MNQSVIDLHNAAQTASLQHVWRGPIPNEWTNRDNQQPVAIVCHVEQSSEASADAWFHNPGAQASAHFGIGLDGTIYQFVPVEYAAWANGIVNSPNNAVDWIAKFDNAGENLNNVTVSIEHEGNSGDVHPDVQKKAGAWLIGYLCKTYGIGFDTDHVRFHHDIDSVNRSACPGNDLTAFYTNLVTAKPPTLTLDTAPQYIVGPGVLATMQQLGDSPASNEQYAHWASDNASLSLTFGVKNVYLWDSRTGKVTWYTKS